MTPPTVTDVVATLTAGEQMIHRLREWEDGDTCYGVATVNADGRISGGKTFRATSDSMDALGDGDAEAAARANYEKMTTFGAGETVLYRATVRNPRQEPRDPADPGEPPLKFGELHGVAIIETTWGDD